jgi:hypothetical protein
LHYTVNLLILDVLDKNQAIVKALLQRGVDITIKSKIDRDAWGSIHYFQDGMVSPKEYKEAFRKYFLCLIESYSKLESKHIVDFLERYLIDFGDKNSLSDTPEFEMLLKLPESILRDATNTAKSNAAVMRRMGDYNWEKSDQISKLEKLLYIKENYPDLEKVAVELVKAENIDMVLRGYFTGHGIGKLIEPFVANIKPYSYETELHLTFKSHQAFFTLHEKIIDIKKIFNNMKVKEVLPLQPEEVVKLDSLENEIEIALNHKKYSLNSTNMQETQAVGTPIGIGNTNVVDHTTLEMEIESRNL